MANIKNKVLGYLESERVVAENNLVDAKRIEKWIKDYQENYDEIKEAIDWVKNK